MPIIRFKKIYRYKKIYGNIYIVRLNNGQIIYTQDIRFYKEDPLIKKIDKKILLKIVFDKKTEGFVFKKVIFDSGDRLSSSRVPEILQLQQIIKIPAEKQTEQSNLSSFPLTPQKPLDETEIRDIESKGL